MTNLSKIDPPVYLPPDTEVHQAVFTQAPSQWHRPEEIWDKIYKFVQGEGMVVGLGDTGIIDHPDFKENIKDTRSFISGQTITDRNGHGTHVTGTACGKTGIAPKAGVIHAKVLSNQGSGSSSGIAAGIRYMVDAGADVISLSLGGGSSYTPTNQAIDYAWSKGIPVVAAAGNSGYNGNRNTVGWPAKYKNCIAVGALTSQMKPASFTSGGEQLDVAAPGQSIIATSYRGGYQSMSGTSMATPIIAGYLTLIKESLLREGKPQWKSKEEFDSFIKDTTKDVHTPGKDVRTGYGIPLFLQTLEILVETHINKA